MDRDDILDDGRCNDYDENLLSCENNYMPQQNDICLRQDKLRGLSSPLASDESTRISLASIREQRDGLNRHRQSILDRVPEQETWSSFRLNAIEDKDLAYLSAATGDEFALLRGRSEDILFHGTSFHCHLEKSDTLMELLISHKVRLEIHTHPDFDRVIPSSDDRRFIASFGQNSSKIISSYTGKIIEFHANIFDDI